MSPYKEYDYDPRNLPQDLLSAIGLVAACSAHTESIVQEGIAGCAGLEVDYGLAITTHMSAPLREDTFKALAHIKIDDADALDELDEHLADIKTAFGKRNAYLHNLWCRDPDTGECFTTVVRARGEIDVELVPMTATAARADANFIYDAGMHLMLFLRLRDLLPPFPTEPRIRAHTRKAARKVRRKKLGGD